MVSTSQQGKVLIMKEGILKVPLQAENILQKNDAIRHSRTNANSCLPKK